MAIYEFVCGECENQFEVYVQGFLKDEDRTCPKCGSLETRQKFSSFLRNFGAGSGGGAGCSRGRTSGFGGGF